MKINIWFLYLIIVIFILWYIMIPTTEPFDPPVVVGTKFFEQNFVYEGIKPKLHVKLNKNGDAIYYSWKSPRMDGEQGCTQVPCPSKFDDNITCWCCCNY